MDLFVLMVCFPRRASIVVKELGGIKLVRHQERSGVAYRQELSIPPGVNDNSVRLAPPEVIPYLAGPGLLATDNVDSAQFFTDKRATRESCWKRRKLIFYFFLARIGLSVSTLSWQRT